MMAAVGLGRVFRQIQPYTAIKRHISTTQRLGATLWEKDFFPGPYPKTEEERRAAAKKYGMQPEDYEPYDPELGLGTGDYPKVEPIGMDLRSDYDIYDSYRLKKNFNEPLPLMEFDYVDKVDYGRSFHPMTERQIWFTFIGMILSIFLTEYLFNTYFPRHNEALPKQFPYTYDYSAGAYQHPSGVKRTIHYTFEPAE